MDVYMYVYMYMYTDVYVHTEKLTIHGMNNTWLCTCVLGTLIWFNTWFYIMSAASKPANDKYMGCYVLHLIHIYIYIHTHIYTHIYVYIHTSTYINKQVNNIYIYIYIQNIFIYLFISIYVSVCVYVNIMCIYHECICICDPPCTIHGIIPVAERTWCNWIITRGEQYMVSY